MKEPIQFTDTEQFLISYYRTPSVSSWWRTLAADGGYLGASALFIALHLRGEDAALGAVGYLILFCRVAWGIWQSRRWIPGIQSIITKYEARVADLTAQLENRRTPPQ
jgi:hypothetical protein